MSTDKEYINIHKHIFISIFLYLLLLLLGCNLNYHKRCVVKLLNDCGGGSRHKNRHKSSSSNLSVSTRSPSNVSLISAVSDESVC